MSNPCINRWGLNSFWHHYWFSDSRYGMNLQQDRLILSLLQTFVKYGSSAHREVFWNSFWYKTHDPAINIQHNQFYRWLTVNNKDDSAASTYRLRIESEEIFPARISFLKFNSWLIINFYWFQPDKGKKRRSLRSKVRRYIHTPLKLTTSYSRLPKLRALVKYKLVNSHSRNPEYEF